MASKPLLRAKPANRSWRHSQLGDACRRYHQEPILLPLGSCDSPEPTVAECASYLDGMVSYSILLIYVYVYVCVCVCVCLCILRGSTRMS